MTNITQVQTPQNKCQYLRAAFKKPALPAPLCQVIMTLAAAGPWEAHKRGQAAGSVEWGGGTPGELSVAV